MFRLRLQSLTMLSSCIFFLKPPELAAYKLVFLFSCVFASRLSVKDQSYTLDWTLYTRRGFAQNYFHNENEN